MADTTRDWTRLVTRAAVVLGIGAVAAALVAATGSAMELWSFRTGLAALRYLFFTAAAGAVLGLIGLVMARRRARLMLANLLALVIALGFVLYLGNLVRVARSVPAIHDVTTNLDDVPQFTRLRVRADNLEKIPDEGRPSSRRCRPRKGGRPSTGPIMATCGRSAFPPRRRRRSAGRRRWPRSAAGRRPWSTRTMSRRPTPAPSSASRTTS